MKQELSGFVFNVYNQAFNHERGIPTPDAPAFDSSIMHIGAGLSYA
jgi:hypothetical protein